MQVSRAESDEPLAVVGDAAIVQRAMDRRIDVRGDDFSGEDGVVPGRQTPVDRALEVRRGPGQQRDARLADLDGDIVAVEFIDVAARLLAPRPDGLAVCSPGRTTPNASLSASNSWVYRP